MYRYVFSFFVFCLSFSSAHTQKISGVKDLRRDFHATFQATKFHPETLRLKPILDYRFHADSLAAYLDWLDSLESNQEGSINPSQEMARLYETGFVFYLLRQPDSALARIDLAINISDRKLHPGAYFDALRAAGYIGKAVGYYKRSNEYYMEAMGLPAANKEHIRVCWILISIAENMLNLSRYRESVEYCQQAYRHCIQHKQYDLASYALVMMFKNARHTERDTSCFEYLHSANKLAVISGNQGRTGNNLVNTGIAYFEEGLYVKALDYLLRGWEIDNKLSVYGDVYGSMWIAKAYAALDSVPQAYAFARQSIHRARLLNGSSWIYRSYDAMAWCFEKRGELDSARYYLLEAIKLERLSGKTPSSPSYYKRLSNISMQMGDYYASLHYLDTSYKLFSNILTKSNEAELVRLRTLFDYDLQKERIDDLQLKQAVLQEKNRRNRLLFITVTFGLGVSIVFFTLLFKNHAKLRKSYIALVRKNLELDNSMLVIESIKSKVSSKEFNNEIRNEDQLLENLQHLLEVGKVFKQADLSLPRLADMLQTNTSYLSSIINSRYGMNFRRLVHKYRIDEARKLLISNQYKNYSMEGIAAELGYKSRSLFYQMFKEVTGITPAAYAGYYQKAISTVPEDPEEEV